MLMLKQTKHRYPLKIKGFHGKCTIKESVKSVAKLGFNFKVQNLYTYTYIQTNIHIYIIALQNLIIFFYSSAK